MYLKGFTKFMFLGVLSNYQIKVLVGFQRPPPLDARGNAASF